MLDVFMRPKSRAIWLLESADYAQPVACIEVFALATLIHT
jgi:hypothetical protein